MEAQIRGLNQAIRNASDGQSLIDTSEGAHAEVEFLLQRMRELAVQSANDTNVAADRKNLQSEISQLISEVNRISSQTTWNGEAVLDGSFTSKQLQIGADYNQTLTFSVDSVSSSAIGNHTASGASHVKIGAANTIAANDVTSQTLTITGDAAADVNISAGVSAKTAAAAINTKSNTTGVVATAVTKVKLNGLTVTDAGSTQSLKIGSVQIAATVNTASDLRNMRDAINAKSGSTGVTASMGATNADLILTDEDGDDIIIDDFRTSLASNSGTYNLVATALNSDDTATTSTATLAYKTTGAGAFDTTNTIDSVAIMGDVDLSSSRSFTLSGTAATATLLFTSSTVSSTYVNSVDISTASGASNAIKTIDGALEKISASRAYLGAISNRLDSTVRNLTNVVTNVQASQGRIQDADFASETTNLAKSQILAQASMAMLAQANASKQGVLSLLQR
jgi:flagellin